MTHLRKMMLEELQRRNYSQHTTRAYVRVVRELAAYFRQPPDRLGPEHLGQFQAHLFRERKLHARTVVQYSAGLRFFFVKTLKRHYMLESIPLPKEPRKLPTVLSQAEVTALIESASNLMHRAMLMTLYANGHAPGGVVPSESKRHRQGTDGHPHPPGQRAARPRCGVK